MGVFILSSFLNLFPAFSYLFINNSAEALRAITTGLRFHWHNRREITAPAVCCAASKLSSTLRACFYSICFVHRPGKSKDLIVFVLLSRMELIVITQEDAISNETDIVSRLFDIGLQRLHLRKPQFTAEECINYINAIKSKYHSRIVIHGCFELFSELGLGGIHLNTAARSDQETRERINHISASFISTSFHSWEEIRDNEFPYRDVFISPVFDSISKKGYKAGIDLAGAIETKRELERRTKYCPKIIGLGGVGVLQIETLRQHGFDGAAMLGAIWTAQDAASVLIKARDVIGYGNV